MVSDKYGSLLMEAILDYVGWLKSQEAQRRTPARLRHVLILRDFSVYAIQKGLSWDEIFTFKTVEEFQTDRGYRGAAGALMALSDYLLSQGKIPQPFQLEKPKPLLPDVYEEYLTYQAESLGRSPHLLKQIRRVLRPLHDYLEKKKIPLSKLKIERAMTSWRRSRYRSAAEDSTVPASEGS